MTINVRTDIPFGNACAVEVITEAEFAEVRFMSDPHGAPETLWFCFRVENATESAYRAKTLRLVLQNPDNMLGGGNAPENLHPVVRRADADWTRLETGQVKTLPDGRRQVIWEVDAPDPFVDVAYCYPYGKYEIDALLRETGGYWLADTIGVSLRARPLVRLSNDYGQPGAQRPGIYIVARQHSGETPGSWMLDGFLRRMAQLGDEAPLIWCVPLTNIDGIEQGDYGKDNFPHDLDRAWGGQPTAQPMRHETLVMESDLRRWKERCAPVLSMDFHAPAACQVEGIYAYLPRRSSDPQPERYAAVGEWAQIADHALGAEYAANPFAYEMEFPVRWPIPGSIQFEDFCWEYLQLPCLMVEVPYARVGSMMLTRERYQEAGSRLADAIAGHILDQADRQFDPGTSVDI